MWCPSALAEGAGPTASQSLGILGKVPSLQLGWRPPSLPSHWGSGQAATVGLATWLSPWGRIWNSQLAGTEGGQRPSLLARPPPGDAQRRGATSNGHFQFYSPQQGEGVHLHPPGLGEPRAPQVRALDTR